MGTLFKVGAGTTALVIISGFAALEWTDYHYGDNVERIETVRLAQRDKVVRDDIQDRVTNLAKDGCQSRALELIKLNTQKPIVSAADVPERLLDDMTLCVERGILRAYVRDDLRDAGLMIFIKKGPDTL